MAAPEIEGYSPFNLLRWFSVCALVTIVVISSVSAALLTRFLTHQLLRRDAMVTTDFVNSIVHAANAKHAHEPSPHAHLHPPPGRHPMTAIDHYLAGHRGTLPGHQQPADAGLEEFFRLIAQMPNVLRTNIYASDRSIAWSSVSALRGKRFEPNPELDVAFGGETIAHERVAGTAVKPEHQAVPEPGHRYIENYLPILADDGHTVAAVVEIYRSPHALFIAVDQGRRLVWLSAALAGLLLYLMLFWIVQRASRRIQMQHRTLEQRRKALTAANQELRAVQSQLVTAERLAAIGEVVAAVAHGIRNPLSNIRAVAQVAMLDAREEKPHGCMTSHLRNILSEVDRLAGRLRNLLQFVRPTERPSQPVDLHGVLQNAMEFMAGRLHRDTVVMQTHLAPDLPPIMGDAMLLEEIVMSLLGNAIEAVGTDNGGVTVTTGTLADADGTRHVFLDVEDTGHGMTAEETTKIFEPFYTSKAQGTGLGLAIARKFTEAHHGTITVQSQPGTGSRFRVTFPAHHEG